MRHAVVAAVMLLAVSGAPALAGSTTIGGTVTTERAPDDFNATKSTDWEANISHTFDNHVIIAGSVKYYDTAHSTSSKTNVQGAIGYTHDFGGFALTGMAGVGQHFINADEDSSFPYYYFSVAADIKITETISWTAARLRYRNAFDTANNYDTPEVATGINVKLDDHNSLSFFVERDWTDGEASYNGLELGFKHRF
ncbi:hypothetical protein [Ancylobacter sp. SL191]|uniref:hypothetical protein n=1 Tax=Ancylobacter sp. SL191 TaxID=2995166 RepID=UPI002271BEBB|nr:hypothetical protein [Ancylobacter sp. SL191]WAC26773.1 hypothetical protein OU996_17445 [Ancylobacter sp. SL191]